MPPTYEKEEDAPTKRLILLKKTSLAGQIIKILVRELCPDAKMSVSLVPRGKLNRVYPRARPVRWVQPATCPSLRDQENWVEGDSQRSRVCEARRHSALVKSRYVALQRAGPSLAHPLVPTKAIETKTQRHGRIEGGVTTLLDGPEILRYIRAVGRHHTIEAGAQSANENTQLTCLLACQPLSTWCQSQVICEGRTG